MEKEEIISLISSNKNENKTLSLSDLMILKSVAKVNLEIDRGTNDYFYKISIYDLIGKKFDEKVLTNNKWELSSDGENLILFL